MRLLPVVVALAATLARAQQAIPPGQPPQGAPALPPGLQGPAQPAPPAGPPVLTVRPDAKVRIDDRKVARDAHDGKEALLAGRYEDAKRAYGEAQVRAPDRPELSYNLGLTSLLAGDLPAAESALEGAERAVPSATPAAGGRTSKGAPVDPRLAEDSLFNLAHAKLRKDDYAGAISSLAQVVAKDPASEDARRNLELALRLIQEQSKDQPQQQQQQQDQQQQQQQEQQQQQQEQQQQQDQQQQQQKQPQDQQQQEKQQQQDQQLGQMTEQQAKDLLDALAAEEKQQLKDEQEKKKIRQLPPPAGKDW